MFSIKNEKKYIKISLLIIMSIFFIVNLYSALKYGPLNYLGSFEKFDNDDIRYIRSAWELIDHKHFIYFGVNEPTVFIMPGLPFTVAFFVGIFGKFGGITAFRIFQVIIQCISMYLLFLIGRKVFNSKAALIACLLNLFYISEYYTTTLVLTEVLSKFLLLLLMYISIYAIEEKKYIYYTIGGLVWGLGCLVRPTLAAYPIIILVMWIIKKYSIKDMLKFTLATTFVFCLVMSPWWIRNCKVFNRFVPLTLSSGNPFLKGTYVNYDDNIDYVPCKPGKTVIEQNQNEIDTGLYRLKTYATEEPLKYLHWYTIGKSREFWNAPFYWKSIFGISFHSAKIYHHIILLLGICSILYLFITKQKNFLFLFTTIVFFNLIYLPFFTMSRYSYPIMPIVCVIAGFGIYDISIKIRRRFYFGQATHFNS